VQTQNGRSGGFEPKSQSSQTVLSEKATENHESRHPVRSPLKSGHEGQDLAKVVLAWAKLPESIRAAILTLVDAAKGG
jgi:hypothetical protein